jgi:hypothetical protein
VGWALLPALLRFRKIPLGSLQRSARTIGSILIRSRWRNTGCLQQSDVATTWSQRSGGIREAGKVNFPHPGLFALLFLLFNRRIIIIIHSKQRHVACHLILRLKNNSLYMEFCFSRRFSWIGVTYCPGFRYKWNFAVTGGRGHKPNNSPIQPST